MLKGLLLVLGLLGIAGTASDDSESGTVTQIGLVNISNQARVVPIGLFNFARGGRFSLEVTRDGLGFTNLSLIAGSHYFYLISTLEACDINTGKRDSYYPERAPLLMRDFGGAWP